MAPQLRRQSAALVHGDEQFIAPEPPLPLLPLPVLLPAGLVPLPLPLLPPLLLLLPLLPPLPLLVVPLPPPLLLLSPLLAPVLLSPASVPSTPLPAPASAPDQ